MDVNRGLYIPIFSFVNDIFFDSDDDDDREEENMEIRETFTERIENMTTSQFKRHFRMDATTFEDLLKKIHTVYQASKIGHPEISVEESCLMCIWYLANIESFRGLAHRFGVSKSTAWSAIIRICKALQLVNRRYNIIVWPSPDRSQVIENKFFEKHHIPGIIGVIDGAHIKIIGPRYHPRSYINRKGFHSIVLQGICDHKKLFTDVYIGEAGSVHDYTVFLKSNVSGKGDEDFYNDSHLIGDLAYKLTNRMLVGFKNNGHLNDRQTNFNVKLSKTRVIIENTFALLKGRFRRLKFIEAIIPEHVCYLVLCASILHNICILHGDDAQDIINIQDELIVERLNNPNNPVDIIDNRPGMVNRQAHIKRNNIVNALPM